MLGATHDVVERSKVLSVVLGQTSRNTASFEGLALVEIVAVCTLLNMVGTLSYIWAISLSVQSSKLLVVSCGCSLLLQVRPASAAIVSPIPSTSHHLV